MQPNPKRLDQGIHINAVDRVKRPDCTFYNDCLDQAIHGKWIAFSCEECTSYSEPDALQKGMDVVSLSALRTTAKMIEKFGRLDRKRGIKTG